MKLKKGLLLFTLSILVIGQFLPTMSVVAETIDELSINELEESESMASQQLAEELTAESGESSTTEIDNQEKPYDSIEIPEERNMHEYFNRDESHEVVDGTLPENESLDSNLDIFNAGTTVVDILQNFNHFFAHDATTIPNWEISTTTVPVGSINRNLSFELDRTTQSPLTGFTHFYRLSDPAFEIRSNRGSSATGSGSLTRIERISGNRQVIMSQTMATQPGFEYILPVNATGNGTITITIYNGNGVISGPNAISVTEIPAGESGRIHFFAEGNQTTFGVRFNGSSLGMGGMGLGFRVPNRNVSVEKNLDGAGTVSLTNSTPAQGATTNLIATVNEGYRFVRWEIISGEGSILSPSSMSTSLSVRATDVQVRAVYEAIPRTLTLESNIANAGNPTSDASSLTIGQTTTLRASPNAGHRFVNWEVVSGDGTIVNPNTENATFTMGTANAVVRANYEEAMEITAEAIPQTINLGGQFIEKQVQNFVTNVSLNGNSLADDEYELSLLTEPDTSIAGRTVQAVVEVLHKESGTTLELEVPVKVNWGNTILSRGVGNWTVGAFTYHPDRSKVTARLGLSVNDGLVHHMFDRVYYSLEFYSLESQREQLSTENLYYSHEVNGQEQRFSATNKFGEDSGELTVATGDILRVYHAESRDRLRTFRNEEEGQLSAKDNVAYLELTSSGYHLLTVDRAQAIPSTISIGTTNEQLADQIEDYLDMSQTTNVNIVGFTEYPDATQLGETTGTILVEEELSTGKKVQYGYEIPFTVESGRLELAEVTNGDFNFGELRQSSRNQTVSAIGEVAPTITISDYSDATQWSLYASASPFRSDINKELKGAGITLKDLKIVESVHSWITVPSRDVLLSTTPQLMGIMANPNGIYGDEHGQTVIQIGEAKNDSLTGVSLNLPANTVMDPGAYQTTITWELVGDPTIGGSR